jgi:hypothetical protein
MEPIIHAIFEHHSNKCNFQFWIDFGKALDLNSYVETELPVWVKEVARIVKPEGENVETGENIMTRLVKDSSWITAMLLVTAGYNPSGKDSNGWNAHHWFCSMLPTTELDWLWERFLETLERSGGFECLNGDGQSCLAFTFDYFLQLLFIIIIIIIFFFDIYFCQGFFFPFFFIELFSLRRASKD